MNNGTRKRNHKTEIIGENWYKDGRDMEKQRKRGKFREVEKHQKY